MSLLSKIEIDMPLADHACVPCRGNVPPLKGAALDAMKNELPGWEVIDEHHLHKVFRYPNFQKALDFVNRAGAIAEEQGHHPDILLAWGRAEVTIYTHKIDGLTESDFVLGAKLDRVAEPA
ncbi:MAG: 4a-hydroxytetrahydrobiopterin dehydratase [Acidobacteriota bacterium]|nr:4a-hydroxytetrahydrobiopterin dehydratase [Acidobacteriota bacterium]